MAKLGRLTESSVVEERHQGNGDSAIDLAFGSLQVITRMAFKATEDWRPQHGLILVSSAVAVADDYFRTILTDVVGVCPVVKERVQPLETRLEFVMSGSIEAAVRGLVDRESFSSTEKVNAWSKKIVGFDPSRNISVKETLIEFERVCHIRHAAVHAGGYLSSKNAEVLSVPAGSWVSFGSSAVIDEVVGVITGTIRAYNQMLFEHILVGWLRDGILVGNWTEDSETFSPLWECFRSIGDIESSRISDITSIRNNAYQAYRKVRPDFYRRSSSGLRGVDGED